MNDDRIERTTRGLGAPADGRVLRFAALCAGALFAGRYEVKSRLGAGGSGEVLAAFDRTAGIDVAVKVLYPGPDVEANALERLRREVRILRDLAHPGIVRVHDIGVADGLLYLVMDMLRGETLRDCLHRGPLRPERVAQLARHVLEALAAAHAQNVVHRDIKPANIFLCEDGRTVLLDFGLARRRGETTLTAAGAFLGTPEYVSPEQAAGAETGPASDLYSLGIVLWEALEGQPPFTGDSDFAVLSAHVNRPLPHFTDTTHVPGALQDLVTWFLEKEPGRRPPDPSTALAFLQKGSRRRWLARGRASRLRKVQHRRAWAAGLVATLLALATAWYVPSSDVEISTHELRIRSAAFGTVLRRIEFPGGVVDTLPLDRWHHYVLFHQRLLPDQYKYPHVLDIVDLRTGSLTPRPLHVAYPRIAETYFGRFSNDYVGAVLSRLPFREAHFNRSLLLAVFAHKFHYPRIAFIVDDSGQYWFVMPVAGSVREPVHVPRDGDRPALIVFPLELYDLGQRVAFVAFDVETLRTQSSIASMVAGGYSVQTGLKPTWITYLSDGRLPGVATFEGGQIVVTTAAAPIRLDAYTGIPSTIEDRAARERWYSARNRLEQMRQTMAPGEDPKRLAQQFEAFADSTAADAGQRGVALAYAAQEWRRGGDLHRALVSAKKALAVEPRVVGHLRLLVDLAARHSDREMLGQLRSFDTAGTGSWPEVRRDLLVAEILLGRHDIAMVNDVSRESYPLFVQAAARIDRGDYAAAADDLLSSGGRECWEDPDLAFLAAMAEALRAAGDTALADRLLGVAREGRGAGRHPPIELLGHLLETKRGSNPAIAANIPSLLEEHHRAAQTDVVDWLFARWAERIAARLRDASAAAAGPRVVEGGRS